MTIAILIISIFVLLSEIAAAGARERMMAELKVLRLENEAFRQQIERRLF